MLVKHCSIRYPITLLWNKEPHEMGNFTKFIWTSESNLNDTMGGKEMFSFTQVLSRYTKYNTFSFFVIWSNPISRRFITKEEQASSSGSVYMLVTTLVSLVWCTELNLQHWNVGIGVAPLSVYYGSSPSFFTFISANSYPLACFHDLFHLYHCQFLSTSSFSLSAQQPAPWEDES